MKFTIAIPVFKAAFLMECIDSILKQRFDDFEIVIVNDASPDDVETIVNSFESEKIRYFVNPFNSGAVNVVDNWNRCLSYAKGDYFVLMGDDDVMSSMYLLEFDKLIDRFSRCEVYHCRTVIINENSIPVQLTEPRPDFETVYDSILERISGRRHFFISDYVFKTNTLRRIGGFYKLPLAWASDDITAYICSKHNGIAHTNEPVFMYRRSLTTISSTGSIELKLQAIVLEHAWLLDFLSSEPNSEWDRLIHASTVAQLPKYIQKKKIATIFSDTSSRRFFILLKWFRKRAQIGVSVDELLYGFVMSIKQARANRYQG